MSALGPQVFLPQTCISIFSSKHQPWDLPVCLNEHFQFFYYFLPLYRFLVSSPNQFWIGAKCGLGCSATSSEKLPPSQPVHIPVYYITSLDISCPVPNITSVLPVLTSSSTRLHCLLVRCCPSPCCFSYPLSSFTHSWLCYGSLAKANSHLFCW